MRSTYENDRRLGLDLICRVLLVSKESTGRMRTQYYLLDSQALRRQHLLNRLQSAVILLGLVALAGAAGFAFSGMNGVIVAAIMAVLTLLLGSVSGDAFFRQAYGAVPLTMRTAPDLIRLATEFARRAGLSRVPTLYLLRSPVLQAMASGDQKAPAIALTSGLIRALPAREVAAVLAHEIAHVRHGDIFIMRLAAAAGSMTQVMSNAGIILLILMLPVVWATGELLSPTAIVLLTISPVVSDLLQLSLSRRREFLADAGAVELTGDPASLASALRRIEGIQGDDWERTASRAGRLVKWLRTHPTTQERIQRLNALLSPVRAELPFGVALDDIEGVAPLAGNNLHQRLMRRFLV